MSRIDDACALATGTPGSDYVLSAMTSPINHAARTNAAPIVGSTMGIAMMLSAVAVVPALANTAMPNVDSTVLRTGGIALAVGLDVLALSTGIGVLGVPWNVRIRVGAAFASAEIVMQILGAAIGAGAGHLAGEIAAYVGFVLLAFIGVWIFRESFDKDHGLSETATSGIGLLAASASISLDSLSVSGSRCQRYMFH